MLERDNTYLSLAAQAARFWLGATSPNPAVGCVGTDSEGNILAVAAHHKAGEGHAEANLIAQCRRQGTVDRLHTLYVTLEPCNHHGRTPPCSEAIRATPVQRVVVGAMDPNPDVTGGGLARLRDAGIMTQHINHPECAWLLMPFAHSVRHRRPFITIKRAFDRHGSMRPPRGTKTFTSPTSLRLAHQMRKKADAIVTGSGTILADAPDFTVRHVPDHAGKKRILAILDRRRRVPASYCAAAMHRNLIPVIYDDCDAMWHDLHQRHARDVLVEAGKELSTSLIGRNDAAMLVDIHQTDGEDRIQMKLCAPPLGANTPTTLPDLPVNSFDWRWILPEEQSYET